MNREPAITLEDVRFRYRGSHSFALNGINLKVETGELVGVVGPSRAGKSTLCMTLNGLIPHYMRGRFEGRVIVAGRPTANARVADLSRDVALVFQDFESQLFSTCAALDVAFGPENFGVDHASVVAHVQDALEVTRLRGFERREPATLSGGQKQRLAIAAALAMQSPILVMDEPTSDLDPLGKHEIIEVASHLRTSGRHTIVFVEHENEEVIAADRVVVMIQGRIELMGTPREVLTDVSAFRERGMMPLPVSELMYELGVAGRPIIVEEAADILFGRGLVLSRAEHRQLVSEDVHREQKYGAPIIEVRDLSFNYGAGPVLDQVNFAIRRGEFLAIIGQNGSGKTTLAKHLTGLLRPTHGEVLVDGHDTRTTGSVQLSRFTGYVFQNPDHQIFAESIGDEVAFGPRNFGLSDADVSARVAEALAAVDMSGREAEDPFALTKGERQRIAVASILASRPQVIILDEPTTGLDYKEQTGIMDLLCRLNEAGHTVVIITHSMLVVTRYAHRCLVMHEGRAVMTGTVRDIFAREDELNELFVRCPQLVSLSNRLGATMLSLEECVRCLTPSRQLAVSSS
jgi:energy-coupling factor transport system ATP-binding protein